MKTFKSLCTSYFTLVACICATALPAKTNTVVQHPSDVIFNCVEKLTSEHFCTNLSVMNPTSILQLSRFERKKISRYVNAFRIMPTITNLTQNTIRSAKIRLTFRGSSKVSKTLIINQKLIPNSKSHTKISYLIRNDVPAQAPLYEELVSISENASYHQIILELVEVTYKDKIN